MMSAVSFDLRTARIVVSVTFLLVVILMGFLNPNHPSTFDLRRAVDYIVGCGLGGVAAVILQDFILKHYFDTEAAINVPHDLGGFRRYLLISRQLACYGDTFYNVCILACLQSNLYTQKFPTVRKTVLASLGAALRMNVIYTIKPRILKRGRNKLGISNDSSKGSTYYGALTTATGIYLGYYLWFGTGFFLDYQFLRGSDALSQALVRQAFIGFCATTVSCTICNIFLRLSTVDKQIARGQCTEILLLRDSDDSQQYERERLAIAQQIHLDGEFAKMLQHQDENEHDVYSPLASGVIETSQECNPNKDDEGEGWSLSAGLVPSPPDSSSFYIRDKLVNVYRTCGICGDTFEDVHSPITASYSANSSKSLPFGLHLPCPKQHPYCVCCFSQYILSKIDLGGTGGAAEDQPVFPIRCPECPLDQWVDGVPDEVAENILTEDGILLWYRRKLLDNLPRYYCPIQQCSALLELDQLDEIDDPKATCPVCKTEVCVPCKTRWHTNFTCAEYQAPDLQLPEDRLLIQLAKTNKWRRCKGCGRVISRDSGCKHITCPCGRHFCFNCGADWDVGLYKCTRGSVACASWFENDMYLQRPRPQDETTTDVQAPEAQPEEQGANVNNINNNMAEPVLPPIPLTGRLYRETPYEFMVAPPEIPRLPRAGITVDAQEAAPAVDVEPPREELVRRGGADVGIGGPALLLPIQPVDPRREIPDLTPLFPRTEPERGAQQARETALVIDLDVDMETPRPGPSLASAPHTNAKGLRRKVSQFFSIRKKSVYRLGGGIKRAGGTY